MRNIHTLVVVGLTAWLFLLPALILPLLVLSTLLLWRIVIDVLAFCFHPEWKPIYPMDCGFISHLLRHVLNVPPDKVVKGNSMGIILTVREEVSVQELRDAFEEKLLNVKDHTGEHWQHWKFRVVPKLFLGYLYWAPVEVNLEQHIWKYTPANKEESFEDFAKEYNSCGYADRPLWEIVISRPESGKFAGLTAIFLKLDHSLGDAQSVRLIVGALCNEEYVMKISKDRPTCGQLLLHVVTFPWVLYKILKLPKFRINGETKNDQTVVALNTVNIDLIKKVVKSTGYSYREVVCSTWVAALRRSMLESTQVQNLPKSICVSIAIPALYYTRNFELLANRATICMFSHPMRLASSIERLKRAHEDFQENILIGQHRFNFIIVLYVFYLLPSAFWSRAEVTGSMAVFSADIRYSTSQLTLVGKYVISKEMYASYEGTAMVFAITPSLEDIVNLCVTVSKLLVPNKEAASRICAYFVQELQDLYDLSVQGGSSSTSPLLDSSNKV